MRRAASSFSLDMPTVRVLAAVLVICATFIVSNVALSYYFRFGGAALWWPPRYVERALSRKEARAQEPPAPQRAESGVVIASATTPRTYSDIDGDALARVYDAVTPLRVVNVSGIVRPPELVRARQRLHSHCLLLNPGVEAYQSIFATNERIAGRELARNSLLPHLRRDDEFETSRTFLASHGSTFNRRIRDFADKYNLSAPADWRSTVGYSGPWIEDHWHRAFHQPVRVKISVHSAVLRDEKLRAQSPPADDGGARYIFVACDTIAELSDEWSEVEASVRGGTCESCSVTLNRAVAFAQSSAVEHPLCSFFQTPSTTGPRAHRSRAAWNLYIELQYDAELFHPYVPLFLPFENIKFALQVRASVEVDGDGPGCKYYAEVQANPSLATLPLSLVEEYAQLLEANMRSGVQYVTVCQRPAGIAFERSPPFVRLLTQTLVLSSGGSGHVPLPLLARNLPRLDVGVFDAGEADLASVRVPPFGKASRIISFVGSAREGTREKAITSLKARVGEFVHVSLPNDPMVWVKYLVDSTYALAPSGNGITSFRLYEALQLGVPPVYVYKEKPWLPYMHESERMPVSMKNSEGDVAMSNNRDAALPPRKTSAAVRWPRLAQLVDIDDLSTWVDASLQRELRLNSTWWYAARDEMAKLRESHFSYAGVINHIRRFIEDPWEAELSCVSAATESVVLL